MTKKIGVLLPVLSFASLDACAMTGTTVSGRTICRPAAAVGLVGRAAPDDAAILRKTGSALLRRIAPGDATTKDFREERVTITISDGQIIAASCG